MEVFKIIGIITKEDVDKINEVMPYVVEISTTKGQDPSLIASINPKIKIKIKDEEVKDEKLIQNESKIENEILYSPEELSSVIVAFKEIEEGIDSDFSDLEASLYTYRELIRRISPIDIQSLEKEDNLIENNSLLALSKKRAFPTGFAKVYQEAMRRLGIPCKVITGDNGYAWNEIEINGVYYPLDLTYDAAYFRSEEANGEMGICKFLTDKEFYSESYHTTSIYSKEELQKIRALDESEIGKALEKLEYSRRRRESKPRPEIKIVSKTLGEIVKGGVVTPETASEIETLKIAVTNEEAKEIAEDLAEIGKYYPELLDSVVLENTTGTKVDMQVVVDSIYESRKEAEAAGIEVSPIDLTISSSNAEDFELDFTQVPQTSKTSSTPVDGDRSSKVTLRNTSTSPVKLTGLTSRIGSNLEALELSGFDLDGLDLTASGLKSVTISGETTINAGSAVGFENIPNITVKALDAVAFSGLFASIASSTSNVHNVEIENVNLHGRKILQELSVNPRLAGITIMNCQVNDIDGLENFSDRLAALNLAQNDLGPDDIERVIRFINSTDTNRFIDAILSDNTGITSLISSHHEISDASYDYIRNFLKLSENKTVSRKNDAFQWLLAGRWDIPYYISDAKLMAGVLKNTKSPIMLETDDQIDTFNFNEPYMQNTTLLLTIPQIERLISSGRTIPQNVRVKIQDVTDLTADRARELMQQMTDNGMSLDGVQIFDPHGANVGNNIAPYSMAQYVYIRETLDNVVAGINPSEPDIDKFAVIYDRLGSKITYDYAATESDSFGQMMYYTSRRDSSRNLLEGLQDETCVCAGYADILRNALLMVGIDARYNTGLCEAGDNSSGHAWNQVLLDDGTGTGTKKWYYTDLTWDAGTASRYDWTLLGDHHFKSHAYRDSVGSNHGHDETTSQDVERCTYEDYDRLLLREAFRRAKARNRGYDYMNPTVTIDIPEDPVIPVEIPDPARIAAEYTRRKSDMFAKYYGDRDYQEEYEERNERFREHEIEQTDPSGRVYRIIEDYPEREEDEQFLLLDKYSDALERMTKYEAGDHSVYQGTQDQIDAQLAKDREYVETRNHTFDQHKNTYKDLATLGKYGEKMPYIQRQPGVLRNITRVVGNVGIFARNLVAPVYRVIGRYVAQPIHRLVTGGRDASPYRNNFYHRMVARRDYFAAMNETQNPGHPFRNFVKSRFDAIFKAAEGNEAVLRAGAADIRKDIEDQERMTLVIENLERRSAAFDAQIQDLEQQLIDNPNPANEVQVRQAIANKTAQRDRLRSMAETYRRNEIGIAQTDAISDKQHAVASKEVNTLRVTVIKGVAKGITAKYIGPKIKDWLLERGKTTETVNVTIQEEVAKERWVDTTYKTETTPIYDEVIDTDASLSDIMSSNGGKSVTGYYSVYGGERGGAAYSLTGDEKITAIFQAKGRGGTGLSDTAGLTAPTLTDRVFSSDLLNGNGVLNQDISLTDLVEGLNTGTVDPAAFGDMYVSVGDRFWVKFSDLVGDVTKTVKVGEDIKQVIDVPGHMETYTELVDKVIQTTKVVTDPKVIAAVEAGGKVAKGALYADGIIDVAENLRTTTTDVKQNKRQPRDYTFDVDLDDIPRSRREYRER